MNSFSPGVCSITSKRCLRNRIWVWTRLPSFTYYKNLHLAKDAWGRESNPGCLLCHQIWASLLLPPPPIQSFLIRHTRSLGSEECWLFSSLSLDYVTILIFPFGFRNYFFSLHKCLFFFLIYLLIYYLFLAVLDLCCCVWAFSSCSEWELLFVAVHGLLIAVASLVVEHGL